ncbi:MAG: hypothetical protein IJ870_00340 [Alphaproteobacteria bacterium]|nr:hypothetical protein [Alphaproteobacteria bacterium]
MYAKISLALKINLSDRLYELFEKFAGYLYRILKVLPVGLESFDASSTV